MKIPLNDLNILLCGDSFAADWTLKYDHYLGWPNLLAKRYNVTNIAQAGVSEYKIYRQIQSVNLHDYDLIIISHTSPYRIHTRKHPVHSNDKLHKDADLIYADISYHKNLLKNIFNGALYSAAGFYEHHYDIEFFEEQYRLFRAEINRILIGKPSIVFSSMAVLENFSTEETVLNFCELLKKEPGLINHFSESGNEKIFLELEYQISMLKSKENYQ